MIESKIGRFSKLKKKNLNRQFRQLRFSLFNNKNNYFLFDAMHPTANNRTE